jgi:hypothetical protein
MQPPAVLRQTTTDRERGKTPQLLPFMKNVPLEPPRSLRTVASKLYGPSATSQTRCGHPSENTRTVERERDLARYGALGDRLRVRALVERHVVVGGLDDWRARERDGGDERRRGGEEDGEGGAHRVCNQRR